MAERILQITPQDFESTFDHFSTLCMKGFIESLLFLLKFFGLLTTFNVFISATVLR